MSKSLSNLMRRNRFFGIVALLTVFFSGLLSLSLPSQPLFNQGMEEKSVKIDGMTVRWSLQPGGTIECTMTAPTTGWLALGFNTHDDIVGTNLIMASIEQGKVRIEDQYVVRSGEHLPVNMLGGTSAVSNVQGTEQHGISTVSFTITQHAQDRFHHNLTEAASVFLICAYSMEDDFAHHSRMRQHVKVVM